MLRTQPNRTGVPFAAMILSFTLATPIYAQTAADAVRLLDSFDRYDPAKAVVVPRASLVQDHM